MNPDDQLSPTHVNELAVESKIFAGYLESFGLPTDNIIATTEERQVIGQNLPNFLSTLPDTEKSNARYLSKFVGATAIGLFDAALNYVWNEVVINLRKKAVIYGIDLFFDSAVGGKNRESYKEEKDLGGLKDTVLLETCRKLELISDVVYTKLDHILTMRNEVAASHPNVEKIGGYELLGWLQTCVKDVLQDKPSESAIRIQSLVRNLRNRTAPIDQESAERFRLESKNLSLPHANNLLLTIYGMYVSGDTDQILRKNVSIIAKTVFESAAEGVRNRIGVLLDGYRSNFEDEKVKLATEFLDLVDGRRYESLSSKIINLDSLTDRLEEVHKAWDNFYHEPPVARQILAYCRESGDIPNEVLPKVVRVFMRCRIGNGVSYCEGVSPAGRSIYDKFFSLLNDHGIVEVILGTFRPEINVRLRGDSGRRHFESIVDTLLTIVVSDRLKDALNFIKTNISESHRLNAFSEFREITSNHIKWK